MPADTGSMRISWWLGRGKRNAPVIFIIILIYGMWKNYLAPQSTSPRGSAVGVNQGPAFVSPPTTPTPPSKWLVVIPNDTDPCNRLATTFTGWVVLLVNQGKPQQTSHSACRYLSADETAALLQQYELTDVILAGILYALMNNAEVFYIPGVDTDLLSLEFPALPHERSKHWLTATVDTESAKFSNVLHFGCNASLVLREDQAMNSVTYNIVKSLSPVISAVAHVPLVAQPWSYDFHGDRVELKACDESAPSVVLAPGTYGDVRLNGAKVHYPATWTFSTCLGGRQKHQDCDIWNIVIQNLLWKTGNTLQLFYDRSGLASNSSQIPGSESLALQRFLKKWECPLESMMACGIDLIDQLAQSGYLSKDFAMKQIKWFKALDAVHYHYPALMKEVASSVISHVMFHPVNFSDNLPWLEGRKYPFSPVANREVNDQLHAGLCHSCSANDAQSSIHVNFSRPWMQFEDVVLIVVFNSPYYNNIRYIDTMYRVMFPRILYCGPLPLDLKEFPWVSDYKLSFVTYDGDTNHTAGAFGYDCMTMAVAMNYHVSGYLVIADDLFLLPHSLQKYNKHSVWYMEKMRIGEITKLRECRLGMCDFHPHWQWWKDYQQATINALTNLTKIHYSDTFYKCYKQLVTLNGAELRPNGAFSDIYYIPARLEQQVSELFEHFREHRVFLEIAVPTVLNCVADIAQAESLTGLIKWGWVREEPWRFFNNANLLGKRFIHPTKWSFMDKRVAMKQLFCAHIIPLLFDPYERIEKSKRHCNFKQKH